MRERLHLLGLLSQVLLAVAAGCDSATDLSIPFSKKASVALARHASSPPAADLRAEGTRNAVLLFTVTGDARQSVEITSISVTLTGSIAPTAISAVRIARDDGAGSPGAYDWSGDTQLGTGSFAGSLAQITLSPPCGLAAGGSVDLFVVYDFSSPPLSPLGGATFGARIDRGADFLALSTESGIAANVTGAPLDSSLFTVVGRLQVAAANPVLPPAGFLQLSSPNNCPVLQVRLTAPDEPVTVASLTLTGAAAAPAQLSTLARVRLVVDANQDGQYTAGIDVPFLDDAPPKTFSGAEATFAPSRTLPRNTTECWLFLVDLGTGHNNNDVYTFSIAGPGGVSGTGNFSSKPAFIDLSPDPLVGNPQTVLTSGAIRISDGGLTPANGPITASSANVLLLHLKVEEWTGNEGATLNSLQFAVAGGGSPPGTPSTEISALSLYRDNGDANFLPGAGNDPLVASGAVPGSNTVTLSSLGETIGAGGFVSYFVALSFNGTAGPVSTYTLSIANAGVAATGNTYFTTLPVTGGTLSGRTVAIPGTLTVATSAADAAVPNFARRALANSLAGILRLSSTGETARIASVVLTHDASTTGNAATHLTAVKLYADNGATPGAFDGGDTLLASSTGGFSGSPPTVAMTLSPSRDLAPGATEDWLVVYDLANTCPYGRTFRVRIASAADVTAAGTISGFQVNVTGTANCGIRTLHGSWQQITASGAGPPTGIFGYGVCQDTSSTPNRLIIHGGTDWNSTSGFVPYDDTYALSMSSGSDSWATLNTGGSINDPPNIAGHVCVFYAQGSNSYMVLWGGYDFGAAMYQQACWLFNFGTNSWSSLSTNGTPPTGREGAVALWVPASSTYPDRLIVYGGTDGTARNDLYYLTLPTSGTPTWSTVSATGSGPATGRYYAAASYDASTTPARMILHGGYDSGVQACLAETFALSLPADPSATHTWSPLFLPPGGPPPIVRSHSGWALDSTANQFLVFAGGGPGSSSTGMILVQDIEGFDFNLGAAGQWNYQYPGSLSPTTIPGARYWLRAGGWDSAGLRCLFYGGRSGGLGLNEVWEFK